jgi:pentatricopeptide repeat protein
MPAVAGKAGQWALSQQTYQEMLRRQPEIRRDGYTFNALIKACQVCGNRWRTALDFLNEAKSSGMSPL